MEIDASQVIRDEAELAALAMKTGWASGGAAFIGVVGQKDDPRRFDHPGRHVALMPVKS